jgi:ribosomal protein S27AE
MHPPDRVLCGQCGLLLEQSAYTMPTSRRPCPNCGSLIRCFEVHLEESVVFEDGLGLKQKRPGQKRPVAEEVNRPETFRKTDARHRVERRIDRSDPNPDNWYYQEKIPIYRPAKWSDRSMNV